MEPAICRGTVPATWSAWRQAAISGVGNSCRYAAPVARRINRVAALIVKRWPPESAATGEKMPEDAESPRPAPVRNPAMPVVHDALWRMSGNPAAVGEPLQPIADHRRKIGFHPLRE